MKTRTWWLVAAAAVAAVVVPVLPAQAWIITQTNPDPQAGYSVAVVVPYSVAPGSDNIEIHKFFLQEPDPANPLPVTLTFTRQAGDQDVINIIDELILNLQSAQNRTWTDYHELIVNDPIVSLRGGVTFISPDLATAWQQTGGAPRLGNSPVSATSSQIDWVDAAQPVPAGLFGDAPLNQLVLRGLLLDVSKLNVGESFQLMEWPTVPEPGTVALIAVGGVALLVRRRTR